LIGFGTGGSALLDRFLLLGQQLEPQGRNDLLGDLILDRENVGEVAIVALGPEMVAGRSVDQLGGDPNAVAGLAHAAFQHVADAEFARDLADIDRAALEGECGVAGDHRQRRDVGQIGGYVLADPVAEIFLLGLAAHVGEGQYANRQLAGLAASRRFLVQLAASGERRDAAFDLFPAGRGDLAIPAMKVGALNLVERHWRHGPIEADLDQDTLFAGGISLGSHPLRAGRLGRPQHHHCLGASEPFLDYVRIGAVDGELGITPYLIAGCLERFSDPGGQRLVRSGVGDEYVRHPPLPPSISGV
jgi:hypothetical protein